MLEKKRIYISDVHMNAGRSIDPSEGKYSYEWLGKHEANRFANFLQYIGALSDVKEIIFIGDLIDNWVCPVDEIPPSLQEIIDAPVNKDIVAQLKALSAKKNAANDAATVCYLPGNHDMGVTRQLVEKNFPGMIFGGSSLNNSAYRTGRLLAEHGSGYAMFNAPDPVNSPGSRTPLGYFISRVVATKARNTGDDSRHYWTYADDFIDMIGPNKFSYSVFECLLEEAGLSDDTEFFMSAEEFKENNYRKSFSADESSFEQEAIKQKITKISAKLVKEKYAFLYEQWSTQYGAGIAFKSVMAEIGMLEKIADGLCKKNDTNIVVFGHSHQWALDKDSRFVEDRIYANAGCWCDDAVSPTFIESQKDPGRREHIVRAVEWKDGAPVILKEESVGY